MSKTLFSLVMGLALVACSPDSAPVPDTPDASQVKYQEQQTTDALVKSQDIPLKERWQQEPELGDCGAPLEISGGKLFRDSDGLVYLGWWSHCEEGNFISLPLVQDGYPPGEVFSIERGPAHLNCKRMHDDMIEGHPELYTMYACASEYKVFEFLRYYEVPKVPPVPEVKKTPGQSI